MATRVKNVQNGPKNDYFWLSPLCNSRELGFFAMAVEQNKNKEKERGKRRRVFRGFNGVFLRGFGGGTPPTTPDRHAPTKKRAAKRARLCSGAAPKPFFLFCVFIQFLIE